MDFDQQNPTRRTMPAQCPVAPRPVAAVAQAPSLQPAPVVVANAPASPANAPLTPARGPGLVAGTGTPAGLVEGTGHAAQGPSVVAASATVERESAAVPGGAGQPVTSPVVVAPSPAPMAPGAMPSMPIAPYLAPPMHAPVTLGSLTDEERTLLAVLRLVDRIISPGTLSPVERAFMAGAKVMFDNLSAECKQMLDRKVTDLVPQTAYQSGAPGSMGSTALNQPRQRPPVPCMPRGNRQTARKARKTPAPKA